jgi:hypothetical protein
MQPELQKVIEAAWLAYVTTIPDRSDLSEYHLARDKELFTAGYLAALANASVCGPKPSAGFGMQDSFIGGGSK